MEKLISLPFVIAVVALLVAIITVIILVIQNNRLKGMVCDLDERINRRKSEINLLEQEFRREMISLKSKLSALAFVDKPAVVTAYAKEETPVTVSSEKVTIPGEEERTKDVAHTLYASSYDSIGNLFFIVETTPSQRTIYKITYFESNPEVGFFTIFNEVEKKVVECRDHLEAASQIEGRGQRIDWDTLKPGVLQKKNNNWEVVEPLVVKFV